MTDACTNAPTHSRKPCCKRLSGQKEMDQNIDTLYQCLVQLWYA